MIGARAVHRGVLATVVAVAFVTLVGSGQAFAATPWWHLSTLSAPAKRPVAKAR